MTTDLCAICAAGTSEADARFVLAEPIVWRGPFFNGIPSTPAGAYRLCPPCARWWPNARTGRPPDRFRHILHTCSADRHPVTARELRAGLLGAARHLAQQLHPADDGDREGSVTAVYTGQGTSRADHLEHAHCNRAARD
jgi:hypothetical protein